MGTQGSDLDGIYSLWENQVQENQKFMTQISDKVKIERIFEKAAR
jgi:hypothetical protein